MASESTDATNVTQSSWFKNEAHNDAKVATPAVEASVASAKRADNQEDGRSDDATISHLDGWNYSVWQAF